MLTAPDAARLDRLATELDQWRHARRRVNARPSRTADLLPFSSLRPVMETAIMNTAADLVIADLIRAEWSA
jgi:hypothetical protein